MGRPDYQRLANYLDKHRDYVLECEVRDKMHLVDFTSMTHKQMQTFSNWLSSKGYEVVEYLDKKSRLLDSVWVKESHQSTIESLRSLERQFHWRSSSPHGITKRRTEIIADEGMRLIKSCVVPSKNHAPHTRTHAWNGN